MQLMLRIILITCFMNTPTLALSLKDMNIYINLKKWTFSNKFKSYTADITAVVMPEGGKSASKTKIDNTRIENKKLSFGCELIYNIHKGSAGLYIKTAAGFDYNDAITGIDIAEIDKDAHKVHEIYLRDRFDMSARFIVGHKTYNETSLFGFIGAKVGALESIYRFDNDTRDNDPVHVYKRKYYVPGINIGMGLSTKLSERINFISEISYVKYQTIEMNDHKFKIDASDMVVRNQEHNPSNFAIKVGISMNLHDIKSMLR